CLRVDDAHEDQAGCGDTHGLAEVANTTLEPVLRDGARHQPQQQEDVQQDAADTQDQECPEVIGDSLQGDRRQGGGDQQVQGQALDTQHHVLVDEVLVAQHIQTQLDDDAADHGHWEQRNVAQQLDLVDPQHLLDPLQGLQQDDTHADCHGKESHVEGKRLDG